VVDRGEEDVWQLLEAIGAGKAGEALGRLDRLLTGAEDPEAARLSFFALLAGLARQLAALAGLAQRRGVPPADRDYNRFKTRWAPLLQAPDAELPGNPLAGLHPFRLHRAYLLASRLPAPLLARLPWHVLETERRLKGESGDPATALAELVLRLSPR
jgi:DNA polymerase III delta subunit